MSKKYRMDKTQNRIVEVDEGAELPKMGEPETTAEVEEEKGIVLGMPLQAEDKLKLAIEGIEGDLSARCIQDNKVEGAYSKHKHIKVYRSDARWVYVIKGVVVAEWSLVDTRWVLLPGTITI